MKLLNEKWIYVNDKKTKYKVTTDGVIYRIYKDGRRKELKYFKDKDGYLRATIYLKGERISHGVHIFVAKAFIPNPENKPQVNHKDGVKTNNCVYNLEWCTAKENIQHAHRTGLTKPKRMEDHPNSVYTNSQIERVCELLSENEETMKSISKITNVSYTVVKQIRNHVIWNDISSKYDFDNYNTTDKYTCTEDDVKRICSLLETTNKTIKEISDAVSIPYAVVYSIYNRKTWKSISENYKFIKRSRSH